jgi:hypothetical protein
MDSSTFPHPASVGNLDHCGLCGRHVPDGEYSRIKQFARDGDDEILTVRVCRDHLVPSKSQREGIEAAARANALVPNLIEVTPDTLTEAKVYKEAFAKARRELVRQPRAAPRAEANGHTNGQVTRPRERRERRTKSSSTASGEDGLADPPPTRPRGDGAARLLRRLSVGLDPAATQAAARFVLALDEAAASEREAVAA